MAMHSRFMAAAAFLAAMAAAAQPGPAGAQEAAAPATPPSVRARWPRLHWQDAACRPVYPENLKRARVGGRIQFTFDAGSSGRVTRIEVLSGSGAGFANHQLDALTLEALSHCPVEPARDEHGQAVAGKAWMTWTWDAATGTGAARADRPGFMEHHPACEPDYPPRAIRAGATGTTTIRFTVDPDGHPRHPVITVSSGPTEEHKLLDQAAAQLAKCRFTPPANEDGIAVEGPVEVEMRWSLR
jgi:TonB family protein